MSNYLYINVINEEQFNVIYLLFKLKWINPKNVYKEACRRYYNKVCIKIPLYDYTLYAKFASVNYYQLNENAEVITYDQFLKSCDISKIGLL